MPVGKQSQNQLSVLAGSEPWMTTAWERVRYGLRVLVHGTSDLPLSTGSYTAAAVPVSKCYPEKYLEYLNKVYSAEALNETLVYLAAAEPVTECGRVADDSENDFLGGKRNYVVVAGE